MDKLLRYFSVLSMLSTLQAVKLPSSSAEQQQQQQQEQQQQHQAQQQQQQQQEEGEERSGSEERQLPGNNISTPPPTSVSSSSLAKLISSSDMSRRKQRNPKPFFTEQEERRKLEEEERHQQHQRHQQLHSKNGDNGEEEEEEEEEIDCIKMEETHIEDDDDPQHPNSTTSSPEPQDLSGMIKVEVKEGSFGPPHSASSPRAVFTPTPPAAAGGEESPGQQHSPRPQIQIPGLPPLTHGPSSRRRGSSAGSSPPLRGMGLPTSMEEVMTKNNMFHFGDVDVANHPDAPPVPMVIPMTYLMPILSKEGGKPHIKYRMFVPLNGPDPTMMPMIPGMPMSSPPNAALPPLNINIPGIHSQLSVISSTEDGVVRAAAAAAAAAAASEKPSNISPSSANSRKRKASFSEDGGPSSMATGGGGGGTKKDQRPLDLSKSLDDEDEMVQDENMLPYQQQQLNRSRPSSRASSVGNRSSKASPPPPLTHPTQAKEQMIIQQQREIEAHLNFLKVKHLEILKNQNQAAAVAVAQAAAAQAAQQQQQQQAVGNSSESRCEECNINFSKHQNYIAHKKYYCSGGQGNGLKHKPMPPPPVVVGSPVPGQTNEDQILVTGNANNLASTASASSASPLSPKVKSMSPSNGAPVRNGVSRTPSSSSSSGRVPSLPSPAQQALGLLGMASPPPPPLPSLPTSSSLSSSSLPNTPDLSNLNKEMALLKQQHDLLLKNDALKMLPPGLSPTIQPPTNSPNSSSSPPMASSPAPNSAAGVVGGGGAPGNLSHFVCDGCGIKFKSVTNLQAHQARYCAGLRSKAEEMNAFEAMLKRQQQQQQQQQQQSTPQASQPPFPAAFSAAEMMSFLNAKSMEQQAKAAMAMAAAAATASAENERQKQLQPKVKSPPAAAAAAAGGSDDFCCILCGYKEQSVERLKDHINMHFIGQIKKQPRTSAASSGSGGGGGGELLPPVSPASSRKSVSPRMRRSPSPRLAHPSEATEAQSPPACKKIKIEDLAASREEAARSPSTPKRENSSSPTGHDALGPAPTPAAALNPKDPIRCDPCDIGFSHLSNFLAHKKYYCRGIAASATK